MSGDEKKLSQILKMRFFFLVGVIVSLLIIGGPVYFPPKIIHIPEKTKNDIEDIAGQLSKEKTNFNNLKKKLEEIFGVMQNSEFFKILPGNDTLVEMNKNLNSIKVDFQTLISTINFLESDVKKVIVVDMGRFIIILALSIGGIFLLIYIFKWYSGVEKEIRERKNKLDDKDREEKLLKDISSNNRRTIKSDILGEMKKIFDSIKYNFESLKIIDLEKLVTEGGKDNIKILEIYKDYLEKIKRDVAEGAKKLTML